MGIDGMTALTKTIALIAPLLVLMPGTCQALAASQQNLPELQKAAVSEGDTAPVTNRLCFVYGYASKALCAYPCDIAAAYIASALFGFPGIGLALLWMAVTHFIRPVHSVAPFMYFSMIDGGSGSLTTVGLDGTRVITAEDPTTYVVYGFAGVMCNVLFPVEGLAAPMLCFGFALGIAPLP
jgi:hypothetical protein